MATGICGVDAVPCSGPMGKSTGAERYRLVSRVARA